MLLYENSRGGYSLVERESKAVKGFHTKKVPEKKAREILREDGGSVPEIVIEDGVRVLKGGPKIKGNGPVMGPAPVYDPKNPQVAEMLSPSMYAITPEEQERIDEVITPFGPNAGRKSGDVRKEEEETARA